MRVKDRDEKGEGERQSDRVKENGSGDRVMERGGGGRVRARGR